ncbi:MAG: NTP transferase domain-containing protein [Candidatus Omnitrophica bacterium]|nr:NTP transferase domain-containing protein [Candidatus Omnitrophota bacterium]
MEKKDLFILPNETIKEALKKLDKTAEKALLVVDEHQKLLGTLSDGDVRRCLLKGEGLDGDISAVFNRSPRVLHNDTYTLAQVRDVLLTHKIQLLPLIDSQNRVVDFITWNQVFKKERISPAAEKKLEIPVVIMAGGKGTRLDPFTRILPKPLIPIGDRPVIEVIIDEFRKQGVRKFYLILNYKAEMIESYFAHIDKDYEIEYVKEPDFYGTAGSLKLIQDRIADLFIVSNCDVMVRAHLQEVIDLHNAQKALFTVLSSIQHHKIPYGVIEFKEQGEVVDIVEKPEYTFAINTGVYILNREVLKTIPAHSRFDMTDLMQALFKEKKKVLTYPVNESDYIDIGQWEEYKQVIDKFQIFP